MKNSIYGIYLIPNNENNEAERICKAGSATERLHNTEKWSCTEYTENQNNWKLKYTKLDWKKYTKYTEEH